MGEEVLPAQLDGIQIEAPGCVVEQRLEGPGELGHAEAPEGAARRRVRVDGPARQRYVADAVRAGGSIGALLDDARPDIGVGAHVEVGAALRGPEAAIALQSNPHSGRIGQGRVPTSIPHSRDTHAAP